MADAAKTFSASFPLASIITIIFVLAKLAGHFSYSWWIVFSPILVSSVVVLIAVAIFLLLALLMSLSK